MATLGFAGLFVKLKDRSTTLEDRLKLLRFAWKSSEVFIPNKEQVLIDLLGSFLLDQKKDQLSQKDVSLVWQSLHDVLHTKSVQTVTGQRKELVVKQSLAQLITEALASGDKGRISSDRATVLGCCQAVITSPILAHVFTTRLDLMLSVICSLSEFMKDDSQGTQDCVSQLLCDVTEKYIKALRTAPNQNQILQSMCDKLLPVLVPLWSEAPPDCLKGTGQTFLSAFTHKDHQHGLNLFLKSGQGEDKVNKRAKMASHVFATFEKFLSSEFQDQCVCFLGDVFVSYINHNCHDSNLQNSFNMFVQLCRLIGLRKDSVTLSGTVQPQTVVKGVNQLLLVVQENDLYSVTGDEGNVQLSYYRHVAKTIVNLKCISSDWFSSLTVLLQLNHLIVEPVLIEILTAGWMEISHKTSDEVSETMDKFLEEVMLTYNKLRQVPKVITKLLDCLCGFHGNKTIVLTTRFSKRFGEVTQSLPQGVIVDIWKMFVTAVKDTFVIKQGKAQRGHFQGVACLLHHFMMNIKVADYSITDITNKNVQALLVTMETEILAPLLQMELEDKKEQEDNVLYTLHLCHAWGEVSAMLALYKQYRASHLQTNELVSHPHDLSYLHSYLGKDQWRNLHKRVKKADSAALLYAWDVLLVQKTRTILLFRDHTAWPVVKDILTTMMILPEKLTEAVTMETWTEFLPDVSQGNITTARWRLLTSNLGIVQCALSTDHLQTIASFVLKSYLTQTPTKPNEVNLGKVTEAFLRSPWLRESAGLQSQLVTAALTSCRHCFSGPVSKTKKRKSSPGLFSLYKLLDTLTSPDIDWSQDNNSEVEEKMTEAGHCLTAVLKDTDSVQCVPQYSTISVCLQTLQSMPLAEMTSRDQTRCLTGLLAMLAAINKCENQSDVETTDREAVRSEFVSVCTTLLDSCSPAKLFTVIDAEVFLSWLSVQTRSHDKGTIGYHKLLLMMKVTSKAVLSTKDVSRLEKLLPMINQLCSTMVAEPHRQDTGGKLGLSCFLLQRVSKILTRAYLREDLQTVCTSIYLTLSKNLLELSTLITESSADHQVALLVQCYTSILMGYFVEDEVKDAFVAKFPIMLRWCKNLLVNNMGSADLYVKMSALSFLHSISKYHQVLDSVYTRDIKLDIWLVLVNLLKNMLISQSKTGSIIEEQTGQSVTNSTSNTAHQKLSGESHQSSPLSQTHKKKTSQSSYRKSKVQVINSKGLNLNIEMKEKIQRLNDMLQGKTSPDRNEKQQHLSCSAIAGVTVLDCGAMVSDSVEQFDGVTQMYDSLVFEDKVADNEANILLALIQNVMAELLGSLQSEDFSRIVFRLVEDVQSNLLLTDMTTMKSSLYIWRQLLLLEFSDEHTNILKKSARIMMLNFQSISQQLHHHTDDTVVMDIVVPILKTQQQILTLPRKFLPSQMNLLCLHSCTYARLAGSSYFPVFNAVCDVLNTLLIQHEKAVLENIPAFLGCAKKLLLSVVHQSDQASVSHNPDAVQGLKSCAYQMERLFTLISTHKVEFGKVATYVVADYVTAVQKVTLLPVIKRALVPAVYKMLDLCDRHAVAQLHTVLSIGVIDVFKILFNEYNKFHKYLGKV